MPNYIDEIYGYIRKTKQPIAEHRQIEVSSSQSKIQEYLEIALKERDADAKVQLIDLRDSLLDYLVSASQSESRVYQTMKK